ncbi:MAG: alkaline phosphatase family protein [Burkholderiales bacterium]
MTAKFRLSFSSYVARLTALVLVALSAAAQAQPKIIVISLDGAQPETVRRFLDRGVLPADKGLGLLRAHGVVATRNVTATPSLTAVSHMAIATGSTAVNNDIPGNTFKLVISPAGSTISGFGAPIGGYDVHGQGLAAVPTATPLWVTLREAGKKVVTATWPGGDGVDVRAPGVTGAPLLQAAAPARTVDYTVPFGAFGGVGAQGFSTLTAAQFSPDAAIGAQLNAAGRSSYSPVMVTNLPVETLWCPTAGTAGTCGTSASALRTVAYAIKAVALDGTDDAVVNYDHLVFFDATRGIPPGPFALPATGPAYARAGGPSAKFFLEGTENRIGTAYFVSHLAPDLSSVRFARYSANFIPRNAPVLAIVDDINTNVGFWAPQPDFRITERLSPGFGPFPNLELEAMYQDQVRSFVDYQTRVGLHAIARNADADLVMIYIEQPDGSGHQFSLTDPRQASDFTNPTTIGTPGNPAGAVGQDADKVARYARYLEVAYQEASNAVQRVIEATGVEPDGSPMSNIIVVSDHGMAPFHTAVNLTNMLRNAGVDLSAIRITTSGPATNIYVNLAGREQGGTVDTTTYAALVDQIKGVLKSAVDPNDKFNYSLRRGRIFSDVRARPLNCAQPGLCTNIHIGQDFGDVFAQLAEGYNFDGTQGPGVARLGDAPFDVAATVYSVPNFYGAHGHDSHLDSMSAILYAAGPDIRRHRRLPEVRNIDIAPTIMKLLNVRPAQTVDGHVIERMLERGRGQH